MTIKFTLPLLVVRILSTLKSKGFQAYIVGGAVRDLLQKRPIDDWDFTTNAAPEQIMRLFKESFYDNTFGTVRVAGKHLAAQFRIPALELEDLLFDLTTFRMEHGYSDRRRPDKVTWGKNIEEDLSRRDFTVNAMALKARSADALEKAILLIKSKPVVAVNMQVIDPFSGRVDLSKKMMRAVGNPNQRFNEDALRMMRAIRIGAELAFQIEDNTLSAIQKNAKLLKHVSWERIRDEFLKIIASDFPADGVLLLNSSGLLDYILPELIEGHGIPQSGHHIYDVWTHSIESLRHCPSSDPIVRLATLLHDAGKPRTYIERKGKATFYNHEVVGANMVRDIANRLRLSNKQKRMLVTLVRWHMFAYDPKMTDAAIRRFIRRVGVKNINDMMLLRVGERKGGGSKATSWRLRELQKRIGEQLYEPMTTKDLKVNGHDVMKTLNIKPGRKIGEILNKLFEEVMEDSKKNEREYLLKRVKELGSS
jgi:putative nucleotidyltransferase with HDIG domain